MKSSWLRTIVVVSKRTIEIERSAAWYYLTMTQAIAVSIEYDVLETINH